MQSLKIVLISAAFIVIVSAAPSDIQPLKALPHSEVLKAHDGPDTPPEATDYGCPTNNKCDWYCQELRLRGGFCGGFLNLTCYCYVT